MNYDTLEYNGTERTLAKWGFVKESCSSRKVTAGIDTFKAVIAGADISDDPTFPYEARVIIRTGRASATGADNSFTGGLIKFQGKRTKSLAQASGHSQGVQYEFQGPWYDLTITQYLQTFKGITTNYNPGEVVLNTAAYPAISTAGLRFISVGDQIQSILQFVLDGYAAQGLPAPFQYTGRDLNGGAIDLNVSGVGGVRNENTDAVGAPYNFEVNAATTIDVSLFRLFLKSEIIRPMAASECIQKLLEWSPRTNVAFDYSVTPPRISFCNIDNAVDVNLPLFDGTNHKSINIQRRDDLLPVAIIINYRINNTVDGVGSIDFKKDKWGAHGSNNPADPDIGPGVIVQTMDLQGSSVSFSKGKLECKALACRGGTTATKRAWWADREGGELAKLEDLRARLQDENGAATTIPDAKIYYTADGFDSTGTAVTAGQEFTAADYAFFVNRLVRGTQHVWMELDDHVPVKSVRAKIVAAIQFAEYDAIGTSEIDTNGNVLRRNNPTEQQHCNIELTNGVSGDYSTEAGGEDGEAYIIGAGGIAQYLFTMLSVIQYEGEYVKVEADFSNGVSMLNRVNFTGGRAEWTTMHAQIQELEEHWGDKETLVKIGVAKHLSADQLSALLNMSRYRRSWYNPLAKADNTVASSGEIDMPVTAGQANTVEGLKAPQQQNQIYYTTQPSGNTPGVVGAQINHDAKKVADILAATSPTAVDPAKKPEELKPQEVTFCDQSGNTVQAIAIVGGYYTKP